MNVEENRLRTFTSWPTNAAVGADRIAKAGFYYTGIGVEVQCFLCGTKIKEWNYGDQVMARHRQAAPDCPFVMNPSSTCNVPLLPPSDGDPSSTSVGQAQAEGSTENQNLLSTVVRSQNPQRQYKTMQQRLESFTNWPISHIISPERLAKAGFYYLQQSDMVECAFCKGIIMKWEPGDDPEREHRTHFPNCDFYIRQDNADDTYEDIIESSNVKLLPGTTTDLKDLGIQTHIAPKRQKHATYDRRLKTFQNWPGELKQTPQMLATAGFYYIGTGDRVRCFHCDGGLSNWEATDDVWVEHARWFPKCGFVNLIQGPEFIKQCVDSRPPLDPAITASVPEDDAGEISETPSASLSAILPSTHVTDVVLQELLHTPPAMEALEIGCQVGGVKRALKKRMEETGNTYEDADELIADVLLEGQDDNAGTESHNSDSSTDNPVDLLQYFLNQIRDCTNTITALAPQTLNASANSVNDSENSNTCSAINRGNETEESENTTQRCKISDNGDKEVQKANINSDIPSASLAEENRRLKEERLCKVCMDCDVAVVFLPCGHLATCVHCAPSLSDCPMCRQEIRATVRTFLS